jgi:hypothetical protein
MACGTHRESKWLRVVGQGKGYLQMLALVGNVALPRYEMGIVTPCIRVAYHVLALNLKLIRIAAGLR